FQAEDGIRDDLVTGVQTCALPICLLLRRELRRLTRVEADGDELELASGVERERAQRPYEAVQHERAEHRTAVVDERQDHRPLPEIGRASCRERGEMWVGESTVKEE